MTATGWSRRATTVWRARATAERSSWGAIWASSIVTSSPVP